ncbi:MAG: response regulator [bacterium]
MESTNTNKRTISNKAIVLIVEDDPLEVQLITKFLQLEFQLLFAADGEEALALAKKQKPDLILLDIMIPAMDGYEVCERLKQHIATRTIPIIFLTVKNESEDVVKGFEVGAADYITKPFRGPELIARVRTHVQLHQLQSLLTICSWCKKVKDNDAWYDLTSYINQKTGTSFTHGICPVCSERALNELKKKKSQ